MLPYRDTALTRIVLVIFFVAVVGYAYYEARGILWGPSIQVPETMTTTSDELIIVRGTARHIASLSMNGNPIPVTEDGVFAHQYLLAPGYNRIILDAEDKYGARTQQVIEVMYVPAAGAALAATTTPASSATSSPNAVELPGRSEPGEATPEPGAGDRSDR